MRKVMVPLVALLLSGCAADDPADTAAADSAGLLDGGEGEAQQQLARLSFGAGDSEGLLQGDVTFQLTDTCFLTCSGNAQQTIDLTAIIPADAPVELAIETQGSAFGDLELIDADFVRYESEYNGQGMSLAALLTRSEGGQVLLHFFNPTFAGGFPPQQSSTTTYEARSVVRSDQLVPYLPASLRLQPGERVEVAGDEVEELVLIDPAGTATRDASAPFGLQANGTAGDYVLVMLGDDASPVYGPNGTTLKARRLQYVEGEAHALPPNAGTQWTFDVPAAPFAVGVRVFSADNTGQQFSVGSTMTQYDVLVTSPGGVEVIDSAGQCMPFCAFPIGMTVYGFGSDYLHEALQPGTYDVEVSHQGNGMAASSWYTVLV